MINFFMLCISHILGDFVFQSDNMAKEKTEDLKQFIYHIVIYSVCMAVSIFICVPFQYAIWVWLLISLSHACIDAIRCNIYKKEQTDKWTLIFWGIDQTIHITYISISCFFDINTYTTWFHQLFTTYSWLHSLLVYTLIFLSIISPARVFINKVFDYYSVVKKLSAPEIKELDTGSWIGILERCIVAALVLLNAGSAIGFVLTAKSIVRFKQFNKETAFAERYLIGTLLSVGIALVIVLVIPKIYPLK